MRDGLDHYAYFADGNTSQIISMKDIVAHDGTQKVKFILKPTKRVITQYALQEELEVPTNFIIREYPFTDVVFLERGVDRIRCWVMTTFNGGPTIMSRRYAALTEVINDNDKLLRSITAAKNRLFEELRIERTQGAQAMRHKVDIVRQVARARGRVDGEDQLYGGGVDIGAPQE